VANTNKKPDPTISHLTQLVGKKIAGICHDDGADPTLGGEKIYGLVFDDETIAWILRDPEGNGPGHLEIQKAGRPASATG
jgi:hypothetical protein